MKYDLLLMEVVLYVCCTVAEHQQNVFVKVSSFTKSHQPAEVVGCQEKPESTLNLETWFSPR